MMAYHQRVNQFRSRIDFDDPSTTKPPSLAKSAVLQALEDEERQQSLANKGGWQRPSRSRQRDVPAAVPRTSRTPCIDRDTVMRINRRPIRHRSCDNFWPPARTPSPFERTGGPSVGESEGGSFAYDGVRRYGSNESVYFDVEKVCKQHKIDPLRTKFDKANVVLVDWGKRGGGGTNNDGAYDKRCREKSDDTANSSIKRGENIESEKCPSQPGGMPEDVKFKSWDEGAVYGYKIEQKPKPPSPPPRRYFLPMEQLQSGVGVEIVLQSYKISPGQDELLNDPISSTIDNYPDKTLPFNTVPAAASTGPQVDVILNQDRIQSKPPLKSRSTSTKRTNLSSKPPTPIHFSVSHNDTHNSDSSAPGKRDEFNINSDRILNLNIDTGSSPTVATPPPQITVTGCRDQTTDATTNHFDKRRPMGYQQHQQHQTKPLKTTDQLLNEIIDENHNYNEKLITNSGRSDTKSYPTAPATFTEIDRQCLAEELSNEQHSKLNVSNQPNRNWINLNSNEIYPYAGGGSSTAAAATVHAEAPLLLDQPEGQWGEDPPTAASASTAGARMTQTRVRCNSIAAASASGTVSRPLEETNEGRPPKATDVDADTGARNNYDNKSVKSNYWDPTRTTDNELSPLEKKEQQWRLERSDSRDSSRSWRVDEVLEFPPPPPYLCYCGDGSVPSGRCSEERSAFGSSDSGAQICDNHNPTPTPSLQQQSSQSDTWSRADNPTISQSCRQDSTSSMVPSSSSAHAAAADVCPRSKRWDDNRAAVTDTGHQHQLLRRTDDYFKTNLTDDKFLSENVNIASNLSSDRRGLQQLRSKLRIDTTDDPRGCTNDNDDGDDDRMVNRFHRAPSSSTGVQNLDPLHKSIDAFLAAERQASANDESITTAGAAAPDSPPPPVPPPPEESKNSARFVSFTDGEYIFGPYDAQSEEFQRFDLWDGDFHKRQHRHCRHHRPLLPCKKRSPSGTSDGSTSSGSGTLCFECPCQRSSVASSETLKEVEEPPENETPKSPQQQRQQRKASQVENYDDTPRNVPAGNKPPQQSPCSPAQASYGRWVRFDNGNISPPPTANQHRSPTPIRVPTPYPSPTHSGEADDQTPEQHQDIFDQFAAAFEHQPQSKPASSASVDLVENVPLIDAVLDDLLTFSKTLVLRQSPVPSCARKDFPLAAEREEAKIVEINDDNLINLLADDDDNSSAMKVVDETNRGLVVDPATEEQKTLPSKQDFATGWHQENSGTESFRDGKCDLNVNEGQRRRRAQLEPEEQQNRSVDDSKDVIDNYLSTRRNQEDIFANVAIFNWNPLDVYHQHGLFMIDPRFALADLHATCPDDVTLSTTHGQDDSHNEGQSRASNDGHMRNDAHLNSSKRITDGADPSTVDVNSFATQLAAAELTDPTTGAGCLLESHKIPNDRASISSSSPAATTVDHFYDSAHVEYPVRADLCTTTTIQEECHQSPKESDYDNDPAKNITTTTTGSSRRSSRGSGSSSCSRRSSLQRWQEPRSSEGPDETEGLKRVAWPPPAEFGDGEYQQQQPVQQPQQPYHYPPQQQHPAHQQPLQQNYPPQQQQQQHYQQPHTQQQQQHQPRERIIPIQRPEPSTQQPQYQPQPTQAFQPLVSAQQQQQQQQQQLYQQPEAIPQQHQQFYHTTAADSQIPFVTTLRKEAPMSQEPTPVYHSEPVAAIYQGGTNMRGDQKWPPADVKKQSELENEERRQLAQQPAFRPRKVQKDYSSFFAKNALNATYPGYRAPPGTQHHS